MDRATRRRHPCPGGAGHRRARRRRPGLGRPLVDTITGSSIQNLKELRPGTVRILFAFDPWRSSILLVAGDKAGRWKSWYEEAIPLAEHRYEVYLKERARQEDGR
ncbi:type II toxin-antitoxin system RelE/ParE family toxin [Planomonospora corallina]|uniref:Type II toxin-antitoxin system RelE/ParE family toxin n=1 Tax=Planomonospora corallina TaxID=1806052 RepID=A0ABV8IFD7_9ACTN